MAEYGSDLFAGTRKMVDDISRVQGNSRPTCTGISRKSP